VCRVWKAQDGRCDSMRRGRQAGQASRQTISAYAIRHDQAGVASLHARGNNTTTLADHGPKLGLEYGYMLSHITCTPSSIGTGGGSQSSSRYPVPCTQLPGLVDREGHSVGFRRAATRRMASRAAGKMSAVSRLGGTCVTVAWYVPHVMHQIYNGNTAKNIVFLIYRFPPFVPRLQPSGRAAEAQTDFAVSLVQDRDCGAKVLWLTMEESRCSLRSAARRPH